MKTAVLLLVFVIMAYLGFREMKRVDIFLEKVQEDNALERQKDAVKDDSENLQGADRR